MASASCYMSPLGKVNQATFFRDLGLSSNAPVDCEELKTLMLKWANEAIGLWLEEIPKMEMKQVFKGETDVKITFKEIRHHGYKLIMSLDLRFALAKTVACLCITSGLRIEKIDDAFRVKFNEAFIFIHAGTVTVPEEMLKESQQGYGPSTRAVWIDHKTFSDLLHITHCKFRNLRKAGHYYYAMPDDSPRWFEFWGERLNLDVAHTVKHQIRVGLMNEFAVVCGLSGIREAKVGETEGSTGVTSVFNCYVSGHLNVHASFCSNSTLGHLYASCS